MTSAERLSQKQRQVVVGVDARAGDRLEPGLARDALDEADVASEQHRRRLADRLDAAVQRSARSLDGGRVQRVVVVQVWELLRVGLVARAQVLWISVVPSSLASSGPVTLSVVAIALLPRGGPSLRRAQLLGPTKESSRATLSRWETETLRWFDCVQRLVDLVDDRRVLGVQADSEKRVPHKRHVPIA